MVARSKSIKRLLDWQPTRNIQAIQVAVEYGYASSCERGDSPRSDDQSVFHSASQALLAADIALRCMY